MGTTYIETQVQRVNRNLMLINAGILGLIVAFIGLMSLGGVMTARFRQRGQAYVAAQNTNAIYHQPAALDIARPTHISLSDVASPERLEQLSGHAVTFSDPHAQNLMFPVWDWMARATGKNKPHLPPMYHVSVASGVPLLILPAKPNPGTTFTGVIRPLTKADYNAVKPVLMGHGLQEPQPFILDCLNLQGSTTAAPRLVEMRPVGGGGHGSPTTLLVFGLTIGLAGWNVFKAVRRIKNPLTHPIYARLARYGMPLDMARAIEAERQAGVTRIAPVEFTQSWLLFPTLWTLDAVPLDQIAWAYKMITLYNFIPVSFRMVVMDREGKSHPISAGSGRITRLLEHISQVRPWVFLGYSRDVRSRFWRDRAGVLAEIDARRAKI